MEINTLLKDAWAAVEAAQLPELVQVAAFKEALHILTADVYAVPFPKSTGEAGIYASYSNSNSVLAEQEMVQKISRETGADPAKLSEIFFVDDDGSPKLNIPGFRLGKNNAERTRTVASLLAVIRAYGLGESDTALDVVREEVQRLKCYDLSNFAAYLKPLQALGFVIKGSGNNRRIQVKASGVSGFAGTVDTFGELGAFVMSILESKAADLALEALLISSKVIENVKLPVNLQEIAFQEVLRWVLTNTPVREVVRSDGDFGDIRVMPDEDTQIDQVNSIAEVEVRQNVSKHSGVSQEKLERLFVVDNGVVKLLGPDSRYGGSVADRARTVAQLVAVIRNLGMGFADTHFEVLKEACENKRCYDRKNFVSNHLPKIDGFAVKGENSNRRLEPRATGLARFPGLVDKVLGAS